MKMMMRMRMKKEKRTMMMMNRIIVQSAWRIVEIQLKSGCSFSLSFCHIEIDLLVNFFHGCFQVDLSACQRNDEQYDDASVSSALKTYPLP